MRDTPKHIADIQKKIIHSKTDEERSIMGAEMVDSIYEMIKSRIQEEESGLSSKEVTVRVFLRYYHNEFSDQQKDRIVASIRNAE